jgi:hypothetical protein
VPVRPNPNPVHGVHLVAVLAFRFDVNHRDASARLDSPGAGWRVHYGSGRHVLHPGQLVRQHFRCVCRSRLVATRCFPRKENLALSFRSVVGLPTHSSSHQHGVLNLLELYPTCLSGCANHSTVHRLVRRNHPPPFARVMTTSLSTPQCWLAMRDQPPPFSCVVVTSRCTFRPWNSTGFPATSCLLQSPHSRTDSKLIRGS